MIDYNDQPLHRLEPGYLETFGLLEPPFSATVDERFYFNPPAASQRMSLLVHMTQYSDMVLMVLGEEGMGKSTLLQNYIKSAHSNWHICRVNANTMMDKDQLLFRIAEDFGLESLPANSAELQELLYDKMTLLHQNDVLPVIIVDDAHELPVDAISQLFIMAEIKAADVTMVHIVLFAEPLIEKTINASTVRKIRERIGHTFELEAFDEVDTADYILSRMTIAGLTGDNPFSAKVIRQIHKQSHGNPARINELAHMALDDVDVGIDPTAEYNDYDDNEFDIKPERFFSPTLIFSLIAIITIAGLGLWQQDQINRFFSGANESSLELAMQDSPAQSTTDKAASPFARLKQKMFQLGGNKPDTPSPAPEPISDKADKQVDLSRIEDPAIVEQLQTAASPPPAPLIERIEPPQLVAGPNKQTITIHGKNFTPDTQVSLSWSGNKIILPRSRLSQADDKLIRFSFNTGSKADTWQISLSNPTSGKSEQVAFTVTEARPDPKPAPQQIAKPAVGEPWVTSQPSTNLTLQLLGSHSLKPVHQYIDQHGLAGSTVIYKTRRDQKDWYVLFYGSYGNTQQALKAMQALPKSARANRPWIRTFASIRSQKTAPVKDSIAKTIRGKKAPSLGNIEAHEAWLWSQDPSKYTLQLLGTQNIDNIKKFIKQHQLRGKVVYYHTRRDNQDWYALVYGVYPKNADAQTAVNTLPAKLKKLSPWVRNFSAIHAEMGRTGQ